MWGWKGMEFIDKEEDKMVCFIREEWMVVYGFGEECVVGSNEII